MGPLFKFIKDFICMSYSDDEFNNRGLRQFCQAEYKKDWKYAYRCYEIDGRFPKQGEGLNNVAIYR